MSVILVTYLTNNIYVNYFPNIPYNVRLGVFTAVTVKNDVFWDVVAPVRTDVSEELSFSFIRVTRIGELGTTLAALAVSVASCS
jgi:hypothetical protein